MSEYLERMKRQLAGDGPAEKQILLLKLQHEFDTAPKFGRKYVADAASPPQMWIARIGALLSRVGPQYKASFSSIHHTSVAYWAYSKEPFRQQLLAAVEEIKLELELDGHEDIGTVYGEQQQYDFLRDLKSIITNAETEIFVVDPYFDGQAFDTYLGSLDVTRRIRILCSKHASEVKGHANAMTGQNKIECEVRKSKALHDRLVIIDNENCWLVGGSIKDAGKKPTYLIPLQPSIAPHKIEIYEEIWKATD